MSAKYPIPLYLNQRFVFDLLAMMEGGLSQIETVRTSDVRGLAKEQAAAGEIGVRNVFAFLGVSLSGSSKRTETADATEEITRERVHTPNSLFAKVRERLWEEEIVRSLDESGASLRPGMFVEFSAILSKNPLIDALEGMTAIFRTALIFAEAGEASQKGKQKPNRERRDANKTLLDQFESLLSELVGRGTVDILAQVRIQSEMSAILSLDQAFLDDQSMSDLIDAEYTVLGKVTKVLEPRSEERINLLRKTSLGRVKGPLLEQMTSGFGGMEEAGIEVPELVTEIAGPAIQVLPICVFS